MKNIFSKVKGWFVKNSAKIAAVSGAMACTATTAHAEGETAATGMDAVMGSMPTLVSLMSQVWTMMTSNPLLTLYLAVGLIAVGVAVFRLIKRAAHR